MKSYLRPGFSGSVAMIGIVTFGIALCLSGIAQAAPQYNITCDDCHRMPPLDSAAGVREPATGAFKGNHQTHAGTNADSCVKCHGNAINGYPTGHRDKTIQVTGNLNAYIGNAPTTGSYSRGGFQNQTSVPPAPLGSCSNVNCHFESVTENWGVLPNSTYSNLGAGPTTCGKCHGASPSDGNHPSASGPGKKHGDYYGTDTGSCGKCHPNHAAQGNPFSHATSAGKRGLVLQFSAAPNSGGSYSQGANLNYPNYLPSQNPSRNGSCASLYCHSNGAGGSPNSVAVWGGSLPADCTGCHGGNAGSSNILSSGKHGQHMHNAAFLGSDYQCARCHSATVGIGNDQAVTNLGNHVDGSKTVLFNDGGSYSGGSCSATLCHGAGKGSAPQPAAPTWGQSQGLDCKGCHGLGGSYGEPSYANAGTALDLANSHSSKHIAAASSCVNCHANTTTDGLSIKSGSTVHTDGAINVNFSASYDLGGGSYNASIGTKSCSAIYCHSNGNGAAPLRTPKWGDSMPADCTGCHGGDATTAAPIATHKHRAHMNNYTTLGRGNNLKCAECHAKTVSLANNQSVSNAANHVNTFKDYSGVKAGGGDNYVAATKVCSNVYCHSSGQATPVFRDMTGSKAWDQTASLSCNGCHGYGAGYFTPVAGEPNYLSAVGAENSHKKHTVDAGMADSRGCASCHRTTVDAGVVNKLKDYSSAHLNKSRDVNFALIANYTGHYSAGTKSCANTYCHGGSAATWGGAALSCNSCHKADATLAGRHSRHWESAGSYPTGYSATPGNLTGTAGNYRFECSSCHQGEHAKGPAAGGNGNAAEIFFGYSTTGLKGSYSYGASTATDGTLQWSNGTCSATYCHSNGNGAAGFNTSFTWNDAPKSLRCDGCHGGDATKANKISTGLHLNHIDPATNVSLGTGNGRTCVECHAKTVPFANNSTIVDKTKHVNKFKDYSGAFARGTANYNSTTKSCNNLYCHSNGKPGTSVAEFKNPASWSSGTTYQCNACHGNNSVSPDPGFVTNPNLGAPNYLTGAAGSNTANSHKLHIQKLAITDSTGCYNCHSRTVDKFTAAKFRPYSTMHVSGGTNIRFAGISSSWKAGYTQGAGNMTCSTVACHSNGKGGYTTAQWGAATNCGLCHPMNKLSRGHIFHVYTSAVNNTPAFYDNYTANRSNGAAAPGRYNYGCANCHPMTAGTSHGKGTVLIDLRPLAGGGTLKLKNGAAITAGAVAAGTANSGTTVVGNTLTCSNVYCHSNGYSGGTLVYATTPDWYAGSFTGDRCSNCHGNWPNTTIAGSPSHYNGNWVGGGQAGGHAMGIHAKNIANAANFTGILAPGSAGNVSHGISGQATTISCNTCHYATVTVSVNNGSAQCSGCHTVPANQANASIADKSKHVNGGVEIQFAPMVVVSKAQLRDASFSLNSSATLWHRNGGYKAGATSFDSSKLTLSAGSSAYNSVNGCSNVVCHFNQNVKWSNPAPAVTCNSCHTKL